jgi:hypothetical protein
MQATNISSTFYLGEQLQMASFQATGERLLYDMNALSTHGVIFGMSGMGKTELGLVLLEEAILAQVPIIVLDIQGDASNLLLNFPQQLAEDFVPWLSEESAQHREQTIEAFAENVAVKRRTALQAAGLGPDDIQSLRDHSAIRIYTPGSDAGIPVNLLDTSVLHSQDIDEDAIRTFVTALLNFADMPNLTETDREHVLLSQIILVTLQSGKTLNLEELITTVPQPPFAKLGKMLLDTAFPEKDRMALAIQLNNLLASPSNAVWMEGQPLDFQTMLYTAEGQPTVCIFHLAHLDNHLQLSTAAVIMSRLTNWMHQQAGTSNLQALLYINEIYGFIPPVANPPTRNPLDRLLKEGRAFGVGLLMATADPGDLNYRALSNAGTWFLGKLRVDSGHSRMRDILEGINNAQAPLDINAIEKIIESLPEDAFLLHNIHNPATPLLLKARPAMSYPYGPMTLQQIHAISTPPPRPDTLPEFTSQKQIPN